MKACAFEAGSAAIAAGLARAGGLLILVLLLAGPAPWSGGGARGAEPAVAADPGKPRPTIGVRTGNHKAFSRLVFDWTGPVGYRVAVAEGSATVTFDKEANIATGRLPRPPARTISAVAARAGNGRTTVALAIPTGATVRHLRVGNRVVIDVADPPAKRAAPRSPAAELPPAPAPIPAATRKPVRLAAAAQEPASPPPETPAAAPHATAAREPVPDATVSRRPGGVEGPARSRIAKGGSPSAAAPKNLREAAAEPAMTSATGTLRLPGDAAAVFERAGRAWIVLAGRQDVEDGTVARAVGGRVGQVAVEIGDSATVIGFDLRDGAGLAVSHTGGQWQISVTPPGSRAPVGDVSVEPQRLDKPPLGARLFVPVPGPAEPVTFVDSRVGDRLIVVPAPPRTAPLRRDHRFPQVELPATRHGVVVVPRVDDLEVRALSGGVEIVRRGGLALSDVPKSARSRALLGKADGLSRLLAADAWPVTRPERFAAERKRLTHAVIAAAPRDREAARGNLVRFYLANGFAAEALGHLALLAAGRPAVAEEPAFRLQRGIGRLLMGRLDAAATDLNHPGLAGVAEAALWRGAVSVAQGFPDAAGREMLAAGPIALTYPPGLRRTLPAALAEAALAAGDEESARRYVDVLAGEAGDADHQGALAYLRGRILAATGEAGAALEQYRIAEAGDDRRSATRAAAAATRLALERGDLDLAEARDRLDRLRFAWRGDSLEFGLLTRLGRLHLAAGAYADGLRTLREAVAHFPNHPDVPAVTGDMAAAFERLFLDGAAADLPALQAIALFDEFRELTPAGAPGDEMIRRLADRLVAVDLLDRAAALLEDQVRHRLSGDDQARVGARLALVRLLDRDPAAALEALDRSAATGLPADLAGQRRHLRARALIELDRTKAALLLLQGDRSRDAELIRAEAFWASRDWPKAAQSLQRLVEAEGGAPEAALSDDQARFVLNRAVALTLSGNEAELVRLRGAHSAAMKSTPYGDAFRLIAGEDPGGEAGIFTVVDRRLEDVEGFHAFLGVWRDRLRSGGLDALN